jgi:streptomycin 6-kinase
VPVAGPIEPWLAAWDLKIDGEAFVTAWGSRLAPVLRGETPAMLKIASGPEERDGGAVMEWWGGEGAARVLARDDDALLMERATGDRSLARMVEAGADDEATRVLCGVAAGLHSVRATSPPKVVKPLSVWFRALEPAAAAQGGILVESARVARSLLEDPRDEAILHGDLHHENVLDFGPRGWLAIDPKGLIGERGFDFANLFCNPWPAADDPGRFRRRLGLVTRATGLDANRLQRWILAYAGLSAAWTLESDMPADGPWRALRIAEMAGALP